MNSHVRALVHDLIATHLDVDRSSISDADRLGALGLDRLDLVLVVLRLESLSPTCPQIPLTSVSELETVGDFVALVGRCLQRDRVAHVA